LTTIADTVCRPAEPENHRGRLDQDDQGSCTKGKTVVRSLLRKASSSAACRRAADRPPPSTGCVVSGYQCFRKRTPDYSATTSGKLVQWRESHALSGSPLPRCLATACRKTHGPSRCGEGRAGEGVRPTLASNA
jgi:hypothetical protein